MSRSSLNREERRVRDTQSPTLRGEHKATSLFRPFNRVPLSESRSRTLSLSPKFAEGTKRTEKRRNGKRKCGEKKRGEIKGRYRRSYRARKSADLTPRDIRAPELGPPLLRVRLSRGLSRVLDEPVNPRKREGKSSPVNAEVMTGVATLKGPRQSAIASVASRSSSAVPLPHSVVRSLSHAFTFARPPANLPPLGFFPLTTGMVDMPRALSIMVSGRQKRARARALRDLPGSVKN